MTTGLLLAILFNTALLCACGYALVRGQRPERIGALINLTASGVTTLLRLSSARFFAAADPTVLMIDLAVTAGFYWLAVRTTRYWPIWAFGFALGDIVASFAGGLLPKSVLYAYHTSLGLYAYLALAALACGTFRVRRAGEGVRSGTGFRPR